VDYRSIVSLAQPAQGVRVRLQKPTLVVDMGFIIQVLNFVVSNFSLQVRRWRGSWAGWAAVAVRATPRVVCPAQGPQAGDH
jgi:hypothetical protein